MILPVPPEWTEITLERMRIDVPHRIWAERYGISWESLKHVWGPSRFVPSPFLYRPMQRAIREQKNVYRVCVSEGGIRVREKAPGLVYQIQIGTASISGDRPTLEELEAATFGKLSKPNEYNFADRLLEAAREGYFNAFPEFLANLPTFLMQVAGYDVLEVLGHWTTVLKVPRQPIFLTLSFHGEPVLIGALDNRPNPSFPGSPHFLFLAGRPIEAIPLARPSGKSNELIGLQGPLRKSFGPFVDPPLPPVEVPDRLPWWPDTPPEVRNSRSLARFWASCYGVPWGVLEPVWSSAHRLPHEWLTAILEECIARDAHFIWFYVTNGGVDCVDLDATKYFVQYIIGKSNLPNATPEASGEVTFTPPSDPVEVHLATVLQDGIGEGQFAQWPQFENDWHAYVEMDCEIEIATLLREWAEETGIRPRQTIYVDMLPEDQCLSLFVLEPSGGRIDLGTSRGEDD